MKTIVLYHANCTDGFGAAFAAWCALGDEAEYVPISYGDPTPDVTGRDLYILDFSFDKETTERLISEARYTVWLDHHQTAFERWCPENTLFERYSQSVNPWSAHGHTIILDNDKSGALLAWEWFHPQTKTPDLIKYIDDRDRWQFKLEGTKELYAGLCAEQPWSFEQWDKLDAVALIGTGGALLKDQNRRVLRAADAATPVKIVPAILESSASYSLPWIWDYEHQQVYAKGLILNARENISEIGHELANKSGTFGLIWYVGANGMAKCSLRSNGDYDVSAIAKCFGGGGHKNAAGFEVPVTRVLGWAEMFELIEIGPREVVTRKLVCDGCPKLKTEYWKDYLDNDETDSGTSATCEAAGRSITAYWRAGDETPGWCPHMPPNAEAQARP